MQDTLLGIWPFPLKGCRLRPTITLQGRGCVYVRPDMSQYSHMLATVDFCPELSFEQCLLAYRCLIGEVCNLELSKTSLEGILAFWVDRQMFKNHPLMFRIIIFLPNKVVIDWNIVYQGNSYNFRNVGCDTEGHCWHPKSRSQGIL